MQNEMSRAGGSETQIRALSTLCAAILVTLLGACGAGQTTNETTPGGDEGGDSGDVEPTSSESPQTPDAGDSPGAQLVAERCIGCHDLETVYSETNSREQWLEQVNSMIARGARLDDEERDLVVEYLSTR